MGTQQKREKRWRIVKRVGGVILCLLCGVVLISLPVVTTMVLALWGS